MSEGFRKEIVQHIARNLLDMQILKLIQTQPTWGYKIKKRVEADFDVRLRHGALYPLLNTMERNGLLESQIQPHGGRRRKVYTITQNGRQYLMTYKSILREQIENSMTNR